MFKFSEFLTEAINDSLEGTRTDETERHRKQYYDDSTPESIFHTLGGRYILDKDRKDLHSTYDNGSQIKLTSIQKLPDSRGVIRYHGITEHGKAIPMSHFKKPPIGRAGKNQQNLEEMQVDELQKAIKKAIKKHGGKFVSIRTPDGKTHKVAGIKKVEGGWPKADAFLHDEQENPVHWMSLKGDSFQQWGGYKDVDNHPVMKKALEAFKKLKSSINPEEKYLPKGSAYHYDLDSNDPEHKDLLLKSMYGRDHGGENGPHNVHAIYSGNTIRLKEIEDTPKTYELNPNALYVNRNNQESDVAPAKILLTNRAGMNQLGTGGRLMVSHTGNVANSRKIDDNGIAEPKISRKKQIDSNPAPQQTAAAPTKPTPKPSKTSKRPAIKTPSETSGYGLAADNPQSAQHAWKGSGEHISGQHGGKLFKGPTE